MQSETVPKIWSITAHLGGDKLHLCSGKPRLGSGKTGFYSLQSEGREIVTLKLN